MVALGAAALGEGAVLPAGKVSDAPVAMQYGGRRSEAPEEKQIERDRVKALNKERQERLKADTDKLLQLATQLKEYVDKTNENILSVEVIRKADEIDRLAKSIREKMRTAYQTEEEGPLRPR